MHSRSQTPRVCFAIFVIVWIVAAIRPLDRADWLLENLITFIVVPLAVFTHRRHPFSDRACVQATVFGILHTIGSHYTYSLVPAGDWVRDAFGLARNHYDRVVHFSFGLLLLRPMNEIVLRRSKGLSPAKRIYLGVSMVAFWSTTYELTEWIVAAIVDPAAGTAYLGTQGDEWDAQKDMALACGGALLAAANELLTVRRTHR